MRAVLVLWLSAVPTVAPGMAQDSGGDAVQASTEKSSSAKAALIELAELGLERELVDAGLPQVRADGELAADGEAAALVAGALFSGGREREAFELLGEAAARAGDVAGRAAVDLMRARLLIERDELQDAVKILTASPGAVEPRYPQAPDNLLLLGRGLVRLERHDLAEPLLARFVESAPLSREGPAAWHMLFDCALKRGDVERARACRAEKERLAQWHQLLVARKLQVRRDPSARLPRLGLALLWLEVERLDEARGALDALLARYPTDREGWLHLGEVHRRAGRLEDATRAWKQLLTMHPDEHRARYNLAVLHRVEGRAKDARKEFARIVADAPDDPRFLGAHLELARLLRAAGENEAAQARYAAYRERGGTEAL